MNRFDDFNRVGPAALGGSTPSDGGSTWDDLTSTYSTNTDGSTGEIVAFETNPSGNSVARLDCGSADAKAEAELLRIDSQGGVVARVSDVSNFYLWTAFSDGTTHLYKQVGGSFSLLADGSLSFTPGVGQKLALSAQGSNLTCYVGASQAAQASDASLSGSTKFGIRSNNAFQFYNSFSITDLSSGGGGVLYTQLERTTRGLVRGVYAGG